MSRHTQAFMTGALFLALFFLTAGTSSLHAQEHSGTEVIVIGTVHNSTASITATTLADILQRVNPDLILLELDPSFFDSLFVLPARYRNISLETQAVAMHRESNDVLLRPFDIEGRNKFYQEHDYFTREYKLNQEIRRLYNADQLSTEAKLLFEHLLAVAAIRDSCGVECPEVMNSSACDCAVEKKHDAAFKGIGKIIELTPALKEYEEFWKLADEFWTRRNDAMVANIIKYPKELHTRKIVVLCGYEHRYYLRRELSARAAENGFTVREYRDY